MTIGVRQTCGDHNESGKAVAVCKWAEVTNSGTLWCRRFPPVTGGRHSQYSQGQWLNVYPGDWCGEWKSQRGGQND